MGVASLEGADSIIDINRKERWARSCWLVGETIDSKRSGGNWHQTNENINVLFDVRLCGCNDVFFECLLWFAPNLFPHTPASPESQFRHKFLLASGASLFRWNGR